MIMENKIVIQNFGPVKEAQINLNKKFQIFIGAQASGKSTICKVVYFVQNIEENMSFSDRVSDNWIRGSFKICAEFTKRNTDKI